MSKCEACDKQVTEKVESYSKQKLGKVLCFECQQKDNTAPQQTKENKKEDVEEKRLLASMQLTGHVLMGKALADKPEEVAAFAKQLKKLIWET